MSRGFGLADWMLPPQDTGDPVAERWGVSGLTPPPERSAANAYRMAGLARMDRYDRAPATVWRDIDRQAIEDQYGGADIHGIRLPPVSREEPRAWFNTIVGETPADTLVNWGLGGTGKLAKGALALGGLFKLTEPAEAASLKALRSSTSAFVPDKPGDPSWWHRIASRKLDRPLESIPVEATGEIPRVSRRVNPADLEGAFMMPLPGDPTHRGKKFTSIDDIRLAVPYTSQGGAPYIAELEGFANAPHAATTAAKRAAAYEGHFNAPVIGSYMKMGPQSADFSSHTWAPLASMFPEAPMTKTGVKELDADIRARIAELPEGVRGKFPGVKSSDLGAFLERQPDKYRKAVITATELARGNIKGVPDVVAVRYAMTHPELLNAPTSSSGLAMTRLTGATSPSRHSDYPVHLGGEGSFGFGMQLPREVAYPDLVRELDRRGKPPDEWLRSFHAMPPREIPYGQRLTPQWVDRTSGYMEDVPKMGETAALNKYVLQHYGWK